MKTSTNITWVQNESNINHTTNSSLHKGKYLMTALKECWGKWINKAWNHIHTKTILCGTSESAHVCPVSPSDDKICSISFVPPLILHLIPCRIPPSNNLLTSTLQSYYQKGILCIVQPLSYKPALQCPRTVSWQCWTSRWWLARHYA